MVSEKQPEYHIPVMLNECIDGLQLKPGGVYVDMTFGGGGHTRAMFAEEKGSKFLASIRTMMRKKMLILLRTQGSP